MEKRLNQTGNVVTSPTNLRLIWWQEITQILVFFMGSLGIRWQLEYFVRLYQEPIQHGSVCSSAYTRSLTCTRLNLETISNVSIENICKLGTVNRGMISLRCIWSAGVPEKLSGCSGGKHTAPVYGTRHPQLPHLPAGLEGQVHRT